MNVGQHLKRNNKKFNVKQSFVSIIFIKTFISELHNVLNETTALTDEWARWGMQVAEKGQKRYSASTVLSRPVKRFFLFRIHN